MTTNSTRAAGSSQVLNIPKEQKASYVQRVTFLVLAIITFLAATLTTLSLYPHYGTLSYTALGIGGVLSIAFLTLFAKYQLGGPSKTQVIDSDATFPLIGEGSFAERRMASIQGPVTPHCMSHLSIIEGNPERMAAKEKVIAFLNDRTSETMTPPEQRAMGILLGMACGDAIGAPFEFLPFKAEGYQKKGEKVQMTPEGFSGMTKTFGRFDLKPGQWTDDTAMGLCFADTLLECEKLEGDPLNEIQLMLAFKDWWDHGYNNAFTKGEPRRSIGLGGNISMALKTFNEPRDTTALHFQTGAGDKYTSGNGSLMRLGPAAICASSMKEAYQLAWSQSKATHKGDEAAGCCELMAYLLCWMLHLEGEHDPKVMKDSFFGFFSHFESDVMTVNYLRDSEADSPSAKDENPRENWNWKAEDFSFNATRLKAQPGYIGSYAMDALAMALHCIYTTDSFEDAVLKAATRGGDADTVGAITGQLAGAIYGVRAIPKSWIDAVHQWDRGGEIATRAYLLSQLC